MSCKFFLSVPEAPGTFVAFTRGSVTVVEVVTPPRLPETPPKVTPQSSQSAQQQRRAVTGGSASEPPQPFGGSTSSSWPRITSGTCPPAANNGGGVAADPSWGFPSQPLYAQPQPSQPSPHPYPHQQVAVAAAPHPLQRFASLDSLLQFPKSPQLQPLIAHHHHRVLSQEDHLAFASTFQDFQDDDYDDMATQLADGGGGGSGGTDDEQQQDTNANSLFRKSQQGRLFANDSRGGGGSGEGGSIAGQPTPATLLMTPSWSSSGLLAATFVAGGVGTQSSTLRATSHHGRVPSSPTVKLPPPALSYRGGGGAISGGLAAKHLGSGVPEPSPMTLIGPALASATSAAALGSPPAANTARRSSSGEPACVSVHVDAANGAGRFVTPSSSSQSTPLPVVVRARVVLPRSDMIAVTCFAPSSPIPAEEFAAGAAAGHAPTDTAVSGVTSNAKRSRKAALPRASASSSVPSSSSSLSPLLEFDHLFIAVGTKVGTLLILHCNGARSSTARKRVDSDTLATPSTQQPSHHDTTFGGAVVARCTPPHISAAASSPLTSPPTVAKDQCTTIVWLRQQPYVMVGYRSGRISWFRVQWTTVESAMHSNDTSSSSTPHHSGPITVEHLWTTTTSVTAPLGSSAQASSAAAAPAVSSGAHQAFGYSAPVLSAEESTVGNVVVVTTRTDVLLLPVPQLSSANVTSATNGRNAYRANHVPTSSAFVPTATFFSSGGGNWLQALAPDATGASSASSNRPTQHSLLLARSRGQAMTHNASMESLDKGGAGGVTTTMTPPSVTPVNTSFRNNSFRGPTVVACHAPHNKSADNILLPAGGGGGDGAPANVAAVVASSVVNSGGGDYVSCHPQLPFFAVLTRVQRPHSSSTCGGDMTTQMPGRSSTAEMDESQRIGGVGGGGAGGTTTALSLQLFEFQGGNIGGSGSLQHSLFAVPLGAPRIIRDALHSDTILDASWAPRSSSSSQQTMPQQRSPSSSTAVVLQLLVNIADEACVRLFSFAMSTSAAASLGGGNAPPQHHRAATAVVTNASGLLFDVVGQPSGGLWGGTSSHPVTPTTTTPNNIGGAVGFGPTSTVQCSKERILPFLCPQYQHTTTAASSSPRRGADAQHVNSSHQPLLSNLMIANVEWLSNDCCHGGGGSVSRKRRAAQQQSTTAAASSSYRAQIFGNGAGPRAHIVGVGLHGELCVTAVSHRTASSYTCDDPRRLVVVAEGSTVSTYYDPEKGDGHDGITHDGDSMMDEAAVSQRPPSVAEARAAVMCPIGDGRDDVATIERVMYVRAQAGFTVDVPSALKAVTALEARSLGGAFSVDDDMSLAASSSLPLPSLSSPPTTALTILLRYLNALQTIKVCRNIGIAPGLLAWLTHPTDSTPSVPLMAQAGLLEACHVKEGSEAVCRCPSSMSTHFTTSAKGITSLRTTSSTTGASTQQIIIAPSANASHGPPANDPRRLLLMEVLGWIPAPPPYATADLTMSSSSGGLFDDRGVQATFSSGATSNTAFSSMPKAAFRFHERLRPWLCDKASVERLVAQLLFYHRRDEAASVLRVHHLIDSVFAPLSALLLTMPPMEEHSTSTTTNHLSSNATSSWLSSSSGGGNFLLDGLADSIGELLGSALQYVTSLTATQTVTQHVSSAGPNTASSGGATLVDSGHGGNEIGSAIRGADSPNILLCDRIAMTILSHPNAEMAERELRACFLTSNCSFLLRLLFEGIDHHTVSVMQRYVDGTGDVQLAACLFARIGAVWHQQQPVVLPIATQANTTSGSHVLGAATTQHGVAPSTLRQQQQLPSPPQPTEGEYRKTAATGHCWSAWMQSYYDVLARRRLFVQRNIIELFIKKKLLCHDAAVEDQHHHQHTTSPFASSGGEAGTSCVCSDHDGSHHHVTPLGQLIRGGGGARRAAGSSLLRLHYERCCSVCNESSAPRRQATPTGSISVSASSAASKAADYHVISPFMGAGDGSLLPSANQLRIRRRTASHSPDAGASMSPVVPRRDHCGIEWMLTEAFVWCCACGHGGHTKHLQEWFTLHDQCPVGGCGCRCSARAAA